MSHIFVTIKSVNHCRFFLVPRGGGDFFRNDVSCFISVFRNNIKADYVRTFRHRSAKFKLSHIKCVHSVLVGIDHVNSLGGQEEVQKARFFARRLLSRLQMQICGIWGTRHMYNENVIGLKNFKKYLATSERLF